MDYIQNIDFTQWDRHHFFTFLQFLMFAQILEYERDSLGFTPYRRVRFHVREFLKYTNKSQNQNQLNRLIKFFDNLQQNSLVKFFSSKSYRSLVTIPEVTLNKGKNNSWVAEVWMAEELFYYSYPFMFPGLLERKLTKHEFDIQFYFIQVFSKNNVEKTFLIKEFFQNYPSVLKASRIKDMKQYLLELILSLEKNKIIESNYKIILDGEISKTDQLTTKNISEGVIIYEKLII